MVGVVVLSGERDVPQGLRDSKQLTETRRESLEPILHQWVDTWAVGEASNEEIDAWGIRLALAVAVERALQQLTVEPLHLFIDGPLNLLKAPRDIPLGSISPPPAPVHDIPATLVTKGDQRCATIAAAAVIAKVARDRRMTELSQEYPAYGWNGNKGYGTDSHRAAIRATGVSPLHRQSWKLL
jgi:ribonuclease HII